jgi:hypothetical protein
VRFGLRLQFSGESGENARKKLSGESKFLSAGVRSMFVSTLFFALANVFVKQVSHLPTMEIVFFRCLIRRRVLLLRIAQSERRLARLEPSIAAFARAFRHDRALFFLSHGQKHSARLGDDDSISFADFYDDYRCFSAQGKG